MRKRREGPVPAKAARAAVLGLVGALAASAVGPVAGPLAAQESLVYPRPIPGPVVPPPFYRSALARGTRSADGSPGPAYWTTWADYDIDARLDPVTGILTGRETIRYHNRSPLTLRGIVLQLYQNLHALGTVRHEAQEVTGGVHLQRVWVQGQEISEGSLVRRASYEIDATVMSLSLPRNVTPGDSVELDLEWSFTVPQSGAGRMGWSDRDLYFIGYWFPKVAVLDDLRGFDAQPYLGSSEFYEDYGDYHLSLTVPAGWTVMATGTLQNPEEVLSQQTRSRLSAAVAADTVVHVATEADLQAGAVTTSGQDGWLTWEFRADSVRDVAWTTSNAQVWNATSARVPDRDGDGADDRVAIYSFYRPDRAPLWAEQAAYAKFSIEHHSRYTGFAYPWPHMTSVEGADIIRGGMEFPMMTLIGSYANRQPDEVYDVTAHELAHMWIPMTVGTNEKRYAWMDEGFTTFLEDQSRVARGQKENAHVAEREDYLADARAETEEPLMRHGDYYQADGYGTASYSKPATLLFTLRNLLGRDVFEKAYRTYIHEWAFKHPTPWDFFDTVERVSGQDLDWFWQAFFYRTWTLDHAVAGVEQRDGGPVVVVEDRGFAPMPAMLRIETSDGGVLEREVPVRTWLEGKVRAEVQLPPEVGRVLKVQLDPDELFPDVDRSNDVWTAEAGGR